MNPLPTERDLPPEAQDAARARAVAAVEIPAVRTRRWVPLAAAASLAAVVGGATVAVSVRDGGAPAAVGTARPSPSGSTSAAPPPVDLGPFRVLPYPGVKIVPDAGLRAAVAGCGPGFTGTPIRLAVRFRYSTVGVVAPGSDAFACGFRPDGRPAPGGAGSYGPKQEPRSPMRAPVRPEGLSGAVIEDRLFLETFQGKVTRDVARVTLTYDGHQPVDTVVGNGVFTGGALLQYGPSRPLPATLPTGTLPTETFPYPRKPGPEPVIRAYDATGHLLYEYGDTGVQVDTTGRGDVSCPTGPGKCRYLWP